MSDWIDITRPMDDTLITWPGRKRPEFRWEKRIANGHHCNASFWELSAHSGTHIDAPLHFVEGGKAIDQIPPEVFSGECVVAHVATMFDERAARHYAGARRLLVRTTEADAPYAALMTAEAATILLDGGLALIGTERLSVDDSRGESFCLHELFLGRGCVILEGLLLTGIKGGRYELRAAPLRMCGAEASPVRALLRRDD